MSYRFLLTLLKKNEWRFYDPTACADGLSVRRNQASPVGRSRLRSLLPPPIRYQEGEKRPSYRQGCSRAPGSSYCILQAASMSFIISASLDRTLPQRSHAPQRAAPRSLRGAEWFVRGAE